MGVKRIKRFYWDRKWEYLAGMHNRAEGNIMMWLDAYGQKGWECFQIMVEDGTTWHYFKRPYQEMEDEARD